MMYRVPESSWSSFCRLLMEHAFGKRVAIHTCASADQEEESAALIAEGALEALSVSRDQSVPELQIVIGATTNGKRDEAFAFADIAWLRFDQYGDQAPACLIAEARDGRKCWVQFFVPLVATLTESHRERTSRGRPAAPDAS